MSKKTACIWVTVIFFVGAAMIIMNNLSPKKYIAAVISDGEVIEKIDLRKVKEGYSFEVKFGEESNTVSVNKNEISVTHASCPDKICVKQGILTPKSQEPIVCLPNKLIINMEK